MARRALPDRLHSVAIRLLRHVRTEDARAGLSAARLSVLSVLVFGGERTVTELAEAEQVSAPTMSKLLQGLEREGLVRRARDRGDARVMRIRASAAGRRALERARARRVERLARLLEALDRTEAKRVEEAVGILERLVSER